VLKNVVCQLQTLELKLDGVPGSKGLSEALGNTLHSKLSWKYRKGE